MDILVSPLASRVNVSMDEGIVVIAKEEKLDKVDKVDKERPSVAYKFDERVSECRKERRDLKDFKPLQWTPCTKPSIRTHPVLVTLYDLAWNAHTAREALIMNAFTATLDMKIENTHLLNTFRSKAYESAKKTVDSTLQDILMENQREWSSKWSTVLKDAQVLGASNDPLELLMKMLRIKAPSPVAARTNALEFVLTLFQAKHVSLKKTWAIEFERHRQSLAGKIVSVTSRDDDVMPSMPPEDILAPFHQDYKNDDLKRAAFDFAVRMQTIDELTAALYNDMEENISNEAARMLVAIQNVEDESFKSAKKTVATGIAKIDATLLDIEKELERAYNSKDYKPHVAAMRAAIETNLETQREALYLTGLKYI